MQQIIRKGTDLLHFLCVSSESLLGAAFVALLTAIAVIDIRTMTIPDRLNAAILALGVVSRLLRMLSGASVLSASGFLFLGLLAAALPMYLVAVAFPGSIGGGDIKLAGAAGAYLGAAEVLTGTALAMILAGVYAAAILIMHRKTARQTFPLGPFLAIGYIVVCI